MSSVSRRCIPAPLSTIDAVAAPTRTMTTNARIWTRLPVAANPAPNQAVMSGCAMTASPPPIGRTVASDNRVPCRNTRRRRAACWLVSQSTTIGKRASPELVGQSQRKVGQSLRWCPERDGRCSQEGADHDHVDRVVHLVGDIEQQHVDAESADLPEPLAPERRPIDRETGERAIRIRPVHQQRQDSHDRRRSDQRHDAVPRQQDDDVGAATTRLVAMLVRLFR